ncbi:hypothetical protein CDN99_01025 [Roseateles aquatilis]|uniref:Uncharacterized protein n=1 Tax=Roseateles aquatilis TaxID=431061 RepID=A0A246JKI7_9BURK|nr:DUF2007 domain-containing protein [Roseateles aquatilis]OWQ93117.1 hypothetical protein CDN99_01025 [Roseateles aquatilis]
MSDEGDFVIVATCGTPTEAHLMGGVLEAAGLSPQVADANTVQANMFWGQAVGVRVRVPASQEAAAREALAAYEAGAYQLPSDGPAPAAFAELPAPVFSPDRAVLLSFLLTPVFGAAIQIANSRAMGTRDRLPGQWISLALLTAASVFGIVLVHALNPGPFIVFRAALGLSFITALWYVISGGQQSKALLATYGSRYRRKSLKVPAIATAVIALAAGWGLTVVGA